MSAHLSIPEAGPPIASAAMGMPPNCVVAAYCSSNTLSMMTTAWWMLMAHSPMMPKEDEILWFGSMWLASSAGFLIAWPLNWPLVRAGLKSGAM